MVALRGPRARTSTLLNISALACRRRGGLSRCTFPHRATQQRYLYRWSDRRFEGTVMALQRFLNLPNEEKDRVLGIAKNQFATSTAMTQLSLNLLLERAWTSPKVSSTIGLKTRPICSSQSCKKDWMHFVCAWMNTASRLQSLITGTTCVNRG